jgi:hypothetical protein
MPFNNTYAGAREFAEPVSVSVPRVFDSCASRECLEDLQLFFTPECHEVIMDSNSVNGVSANVSDVTFNIKKSPVNENIHTVDSTFYFEVELLACRQMGSEPVRLIGRGYHQKSCTLRCPENNVRIFTSAGQVNPVSSDPTVSAQVSAPVLLGIRLTDAPAFALEQIPGDVSVYYMNDRLVLPISGDKIVLCTLGVFSVFSAQRTVQMVVPGLGYAFPQSECAIAESNPCNVFKRIDFPVRNFFPAGRQMY